jgi:hypothetical protein
MGPRSAIVERLRNVLEEIARDPSPLESRRRAGLHRVRTQFTWGAKASQVLEVYRWVLGGRPNKPDFGMPMPDPDPIPIESREPVVST